MANYEYHFVSCQQGQFAEVCNRVAADEFSVDHFVKDGNHFYILFSKYVYDEAEDDIEETAADELWDEVYKLRRQLKVLTELMVPSKKEAEAPSEE